MMTTSHDRLKPISDEGESCYSWPKLVVLLALALIFTVFATVAMVSAIRGYRAEWLTVEGEALSGHIHVSHSSSGRHHSSEWYEPRIYAAYTVGDAPYRQTLTNLRSEARESEAKAHLRKILDQRKIVVAYNSADSQEAYFEKAPIQQNLGGAIIFSQVAIALLAFGGYKLRQRLLRDRKGK